MKKALLIFSLLFNVCLFSKAQFKQIAAGPEFNEPYSVSSQFLLLKNGNLVFTDIGFRDSILIRVYNTAHKEIAVTSYLMSSPAKRTYLGLKAVFEINGDAVLFIIAEEDKANVLYRVIVDPNSGLVKKEEKIFGLKPQTRNESYAVWRGNLGVSKVADSDDYAIMYCNNFRSEKIKKIEIVLFNKDNVETGRSFYETAEKEFEYLDFNGMTVINSEKVALLFAGYTWTNNLRDQDQKLSLAIMKKGSSTLSIIKLNLPEDKVPNNPKIYYNSQSKRLIVVAVCGGKKVDQYLCFFDPETGKAEKIITVNFSDAINEKIKEVNGKKYDFFGKPANLLVEKSGGFSVVFEEDGYESMGPQARFTHYYTYDIIVANFDKNGKLLNSYLIPKKFVFNPPGSLNYGGGFGNEYLKLAYIKRADKGYLFINDTRENIERLETNKDPNLVSVVKDCDAFYFPLTGNDPIPARKYLFGETDEKEDHIQSPFGVFAYDKENDVFITLRLNRDEKKRTKTVNVVWLKPE